MEKPIEKLTDKPVFRKLRGYAFDPSFSSTVDKRQSNEVIYKVRWEEELKPGPSGEYIEIVDYDPTTECFYEQIDLNDPYVLADNGLPLSEGDPRFHQQQVYAVVMSIIAQFEKALSRKIIWSRIVDKNMGNTEFVNQFVPKLRIYPHALRQQNAYYSPSKLALLFGYFQASEQWEGNNVPGSAIFTCLSPDIVAHEVTHAILDSLHPYLRKDTNRDMLAFHEGFADIIALLQRFTFQNVVEDQLRISRGDLMSSHNFLGDLALQFGQAISGNRRALRSFLVETLPDGSTQLVKPDPTKYRDIKDPHERGGLLVAAIFDAFVRLYRFKTFDLIRLASGGTGILEKGEIHPDLVRRLAAEARGIADKLMLTCIRALDYSPPVGLNFGDYLRALITADVEHNPEDEEGLRFALLESFRSWGIVPDDLVSYSVAQLMWKPPSANGGPKRAIEALEKAFKYIFDTESAHLGVMEHMEKILRSNTREEIFMLSGFLSARVHDMLMGKFAINESQLERSLGMCFDDINYSFQDETFKVPIKLKAHRRPVFQVYKCRPLIRYNSRDGYAYKILIITFLQKVYIDLRKSPYEEFFNESASSRRGADQKPKYMFDFRGGATLILDLSDFKIKYIIMKDITSSARLQKHLKYALDRDSNESNSALLMQNEEPFAALHIH